MKHFYIYKKTNESCETSYNYHCRYFHNFNAAKAALNEEAEYLIEKMNGNLIYARDNFNSDKGFYEYEKTLIVDNNRMTLAIIDAYFEDEEIV